MNTDQQRAHDAWKVVQKAKNLSSDKQKEFGRNVLQAAPRILTSGLGPTLAFLQAKKFAPDLTAALNNWIHQRRPAVRDTDDDKDLTRRIMLEDAAFLRYVTAESIAYLQWLKRFSEAEGLTKDAEN